MASDFDMTAAFDAAALNEQDVFPNSDLEDADGWMQGLQAQWAINREQKAAKRARRAALIHAPTQTAGEARGLKGLSKVQRKRLAKQQRKAAMYADVLDAAGADVIPSDPSVPEGFSLHAQLLKANEDLAHFHATVGKSKGKGKKADRTSGRFSLGDLSSASASEVADQMTLRVDTHDASQLSFPPMHKAARALLHQLAKAYGLSSKSHGKGELRYTVASLPSSAVGSNPKAPRVDSRAVVRILDNAVRADRKGTAGIKKILDTNGTGRGGLKGAASAPRNKDGQLVGFGADKIGDENLGYRMLAMMGWQHGAGLGQRQGIAEPISATVKVSKGGLGF